MENEPELADDVVSVSYWSVPYHVTCIEGIDWIDSCAF